MSEAPGGSYSPLTTPEMIFDRRAARSTRKLLLEELRLGLRLMIPDGPDLPGEHIRREFLALIGRIGMDRLEEVLRPNRYDPHDYQYMVAAHTVALDIDRSFDRASVRAELGDGDPLSILGSDRLHQESLELRYGSTLDTYDWPAWTQAVVATIERLDLANKLANAGSRLEVRPTPAEIREANKLIAAQQDLAQSSVLLAVGRLERVARSDIPTLSRFAMLMGEAGAAETAKLRGESRKKTQEHLAAATRAVYSDWNDLREAAHSVEHRCGCGSEVQASYAPARARAVAARPIDHRGGASRSGCHSGGVSVRPRRRSSYR